MTERREGDIEVLVISGTVWEAEYDPNWPEGCTSKKIGPIVLGTDGVLRCVPITKTTVSDKELEVQFALGTLTPLKLFLKMLSMQNRTASESEGWFDERAPKITTQDDGDIHIEISNEVVFVFNSEEEFMGMFNYK